MPNDTSEQAPMKKRKGSTSNKQVEANRKNAQASTGPKSADGKRRSSANAIRHGAYAHELYPIQHGVLAEDADDFYRRAEELIAGFDPRDTLEAVMAKRLADALLRLDRLDRFEAAMMVQEALPNAAVTDLYKDFRAAEDLEIDADVVARIVEAEVAGDELALEHGCWQLAARFLRAHGPIEVGAIGDLWTETTEPTDEAGWERVTRLLLQHFWPEMRDRLAAVSGMRFVFGHDREKAEHNLSAMVATRIINLTMDTAARPRHHAWREFQLALSAMHVLKARPLDGDQG